MGHKINRHVGIYIYIYILCTANVLEVYGYATGYYFIITYYCYNDKLSS